MKKFAVISTMALLAFSLMGCSMGGPTKTEKITDPAAISEMDQIITEKVAYYFGYDVDPNVERDYQALKSYIPAGEDTKEMVHHANIFQAVSKDDPVEGTLHGYGGILTPDNQDLKGLIINVYNGRDEEVKAYTDEQLTQIASDFLKEKELVPSDATLTFSGYNADATSDTLKVVLIDSEIQRFAVGIDAVSGETVYFELAENIGEKK